MERQTRSLRYLSIVLIINALIKLCYINIYCGKSGLAKIRVASSFILKKCFRAVVKRVVGFFGNLTISFKFAFKMYIDDLREDGAVFWIYFIIIVITLHLSVSGFINFSLLLTI